MRPRAASLSVVVPGLLDLAAALTRLPRKEQPRFPVLETLLARGTRTAGAGRDLDSVVFGAFGIAPEEGTDLPVAAVTRVADGAAPDDAYWLRADPVHLQPDRDRLLLADAAPPLDASEAQALVEAVNQHFAEDGWRLDAPTPHRWYLRVDTPPALLTSNPLAALGRDIDAHLPRGPGGKAWHVALNEVQMLLHAHPVNQAREARGAPPVNSLWFWGSGRAPQPGASFTGVLSDGPLAAGLAILAGVPAASLDTLGQRLGQEEAGRLLLVWEHLAMSAALGDVYAWLDQLALFERQCLTACWAALRAGRLARLTLLPCDGTALELERGARWRWWKRPKPLAAYG